jgi:hypothetical protein
MNPFQRGYKVIEIARRMAEKANKNVYMVDDIGLYEGYAEPGYGDGLVALGNWNSWGSYPAPKDRRHIANLPRRVGDILNKLGFTLDWNDEYCECSRCYRPVRTQPDSYRWERSYFELDGEIVCISCLSDEDKKDYLQEIEGDYRKAVPSIISPDDFGYHKVGGTFENGLYGGQADSPEKIAAALETANINKFVFRISGVGQFDVHFEVYIHKDELGQEVDKRLQEIGAYLYGTPLTGPDPAEMMKKALSSCKIHSNPNGIVYNKVDLNDGTVDTRIVSKEEFIKGIKD